MKIYEINFLSNGVLNFAGQSSFSFVMLRLALLGKIGMIAIIKTGGKQYLVSPGKKIKIEKLNAEAGKEVVFDQVLLSEKNKKIEIGNPLVEGAKVIGKVLSHGKGKKLIVFSYRPKKRYRRKKGHRQQFTQVEITKIETK